MIRILKDKNLTFTDYTNELKEYKTRTATINIVAATDKLYFLQRFPFNHLYFKFDGSNVNAAASSITVEYYDGTNWRESVNTLDETILSTASFGQDGFITFMPNKQYRWNREDTVKSNGTENISGLGNVTIYDSYPLRFTFNGDLTATTALKWVGNLFCLDADLYAEHPRLNNSDFLTSVESGKTDWEEQRVVASRLVIDDLIRREIIIHPGQILDRDKMRLMTVSMTAYLIYNMLGSDFNDERDQALKEFENRRELKIYNVDTDRDARLDNNEILRSSTLRRR